MVVLVEVLHQEQTLVLLEQVYQHKDFQVVQVATTLRLVEAVEVELLLLEAQEHLWAGPMAAMEYLLL
jgi:hypothetical protein